MIMNRSGWMLAAMSVKGTESFSPVQMQKLMFMLSKNLPLPELKFDFKPYDYGPFDADVYRELETLAKEGDVSIEGDGRKRRYRLTATGVAKGATCLNETGLFAQYVKDLVRWITSLTFPQLVTEIYKLYPEMKVNSVFNQ